MLLTAESIRTGWGLGDEASFAGLREEWNALVDRCPDASPYLRHEWLTAWWGAFGAGSEMRVRLVKRGGELVAAAPFAATRRRLSGLPAKVLHLFGDHISHPGLAVLDPASLSVLVGPETLRGCDVAVLDGVCGGTDLDRAIRTSFERSGMGILIHPYSEIVLDAAGGLEQYRAGRSTKFWSNLRNRRKRLAREGEVCFERHRSVSEPDELVTLLDGIAKKSWKAHDAENGMQSKYQELFRRLLRHEIDLCILRVGGTPIAYRMGWTKSAVFVEHDIAYDLDWRKFSPGTLLSAHHNELLVSEGVREINLGMDFEWKSEWSPRRRTLHCYFVFPRRGLYPRLIELAARFRYRRAQSAERGSP